MKDTLMKQSISLYEHDRIEIKSIMCTLNTGVSTLTMQLQNDMVHNEMVKNYFSCSNTQQLYINVFYTSNDIGVALPTLSCGFSK